MKLAKVLAVLTAVITSLVLANISFRREILYLVPHHDLPGYADTGWSHEDPPDIVLAAAVSVPLVECVIPDKTDVLFAVSVDGHRYFVGSGQFSVRRRQATLSEAWLDPEATLSCRPYLRGVTALAPNNSSKPTPLRGAA